MRCCCCSSESSCAVADTAAINDVVTNLLFCYCYKLLLLLLCLLKVVAFVIRDTLSVGLLPRRPPPPSAFGKLDAPFSVRNIHVFVRDDVAQAVYYILTNCSQGGCWMKEGPAHVRTYQKRRQIGEWNFAGMKFLPISKAS